MNTHAKRFYSKDDMYQIIEHLEARLSKYENGIKEGKIIVLPCKLGDTVYVVYGRYTQCSKNASKYGYKCRLCDRLRLDCDSKYEYYIKEEKAESIDWIIQKLIYHDDSDGIAFLSIEDACACAAEYNSCIYSNSDEEFIQTSSNNSFRNKAIQYWKNRNAISMVR